MANYAETLLASGERILRRAHQHWFVLIANARYAVLALIAALVLTVGAVWFNLSGTTRDALGIVTLVLFVFGVLSLLWAALRYQNEEYLITNRRLIHAEGVVNKKTTDSSLEKINDAVLSESLVGRLFGFGDLDVLTASEEGVERLRMLRDAKSFKKAMIEAKHELEIELTRPTMPPLRSEPAPSVVGERAYPAAAGPLEPARVAPMAPPPAPVPVPVPAPVAVAPAAPAAPPDATNGRTDDIAESLDRLGQLRDKGLITPEEFEAKRQDLLDRL